MENKELKDNNDNHEFKFKNLLFSIAGLTAIASFLYFNYVCNYLNYYNINDTLSFLNNIYGYSLAAILTIIITVPLFTTIFTFNSLEKAPQQKDFLISEELDKYLEMKFQEIFKTTKSKVIFGIILIIISIIFSNIILYALIHEFIGIKIDIIQIVWLLVFYVVLIAVYIFIKKSISKEYSIYIIFIIAFCMLFNITGKAGYNYAKEKKDFIITNEFIFVYNTNEYGIGCKYKIDEDTNTVTIDTSKYVKIDINGLVLENKLFEEVKFGKIEENNNE